MLLRSNTKFFCLLKITVFTSCDSSWVFIRDVWDEIIEKQNSKTTYDSCLLIREASNVNLSPKSTRTISTN